MPSSPRLRVRAARVMNATRPCNRSSPLPPSRPARLCAVCHCSGLAPVKIKKAPKWPYVFFTFNNEDERLHAIKTFDGETPLPFHICKRYVWLH